MSDRELEKYSQHVVQQLERQRDALVEALLVIRKAAANPGNQALALTDIFRVATRASRLEFDASVSPPLGSDNE